MDVHDTLSRMSKMRVWPHGLHGYLKWYRWHLKAFVKGALFDNFMTISVAVNTCVLALDRYGIPAEEEAILDDMNTVFTYIFCFELAIKLLALGIKKYVKEKMNILDGGVVMLSIVELSMSGSGGAVSAFRTVRIFRTFRVIRVTRLLRGLSSMKIIVSVITKSAKSFCYLAMLLFLFIFIYTLLGMQTFGSKFNFEDGVPRTNFASF